jgi:hypothetical protein
MQPLTPTRKEKSKDKRTASWKKSKSSDYG